MDGTTIDSASLTRRIDELTRAADVQGLTVTIFNDAETVYSRAFGFADLPAGRRLRLDTELYGASLSKAVFAVLVMKLVEQGVLDLDTPLQDYVEEPLWQNQGTEWHEDLRAGACSTRPTGGARSRRGMAMAFSTTRSSSRQVIWASS